MTETSTSSLVHSAHIHRRSKPEDYNSVNNLAFIAANKFYILPQLFSFCSSLVVILFDLDDSRFSALYLVLVKPITKFKDKFTLSAEVQFETKILLGVICILKSYRYFCITVDIFMILLQYIHNTSNILLSNLNN